MKTVAQERDELKTQVTDLTKQLAESQVKLGGLQTTIEAQGASITDLTGKITSAETKLTEIRGKLTAAEAEVAKLKGEAMTVEQKAAEIVAAAGGKSETVAEASKTGEPMSLETATAEYQKLQKTSPARANDFYNKHRDIFVPKDKQARV